MSNKQLYIDFEFNGTTEKNLNLVCCSYSTSDGSGVVEHWLNKNVDESYYPLWAELSKYADEGYDFVAYNVVAEARALLSLGMDVTKIKWVDLFLEYRCLLNHSDLQFGKQLIDGKVHRNPPNRFDSNFKKPGDSLAASTYKLLGVKLDTDHKSFMRDVVIDGRYVEDYKEDIQAYCSSDIKYLPALLKEVVKLYAKRLNKKELSTLKSEMYWRGEYAARTAMMESVGYPIDYEATKNFSKSVSDILNEIAEDVNEQFPELMPFERNKATRKYVFKQKKAKEQIDIWVKDNNKDWEVSEKTQEYSLSVDAYSKHFNYRHDFPRGNYFAQVLRYKKAEQHMNGFKPKKKASNCWEDTDILKSSDMSNKRRRTFFDAVGSDQRVRPYFNIYGSQSSRSQPPATYYMFLKAAWMRALVVPPKGRAIIGIDFGQQEFLLKGLMSKDPEMMKAYDSGDVYLYFGKRTGGIPQEADKSHPLRDKYKSTTLGIQFLMSKFGLSTKLTNDTGEYHSEEDAQELIDDFNDLYEIAAEHSEDLIERYHEEGKIKLPDGFYMWGQNPNDRSVANCPVQGFGACIMRKAVQLSQDKKQDIILTLHDALYIECDVNKIKENIILLANCMDEAFKFFFKGTKLEEKANIRLDADVWSPELKNDKFDLKYCNGVIPVKQQTVYIDGRSASEYEKFSKYFIDRYRTDLL